MTDGGAAVVNEPEVKILKGKMNTVTAPVDVPSAVTTLKLELEPYILNHGERNHEAEQRKQEV